MKTPEQNPENSVQRLITEAIMTHDHKGNGSVRVNWFDIFGYVDVANVISATIATTGNTDTYIMAEVTGNVIEIDFSGVDALAASDTNYITWTVTNLGQDGSGSAALLKAADVNTTKATGGSALAANTKRTFTLTATLNNLQVQVGDRIRIRAAVTGTLANTVTFPVYLFQIQTQ